MTCVPQIMYTLLHTHFYFQFYLITLTVVSVDTRLWIGNVRDSLPGRSLDVFLFSETPISFLRLTQNPIWWVPEFFLGSRAGRSVVLTTQLRLLPSLRISGFLSLLPHNFHRNDSVTRSNAMPTSEQWTGQDVAGNDHGLNSGTIITSYWRNWEKPRRRLRCCLSINWNLKIR